MSQVCTFPYWCCDKRNSADSGPNPLYTYYVCIPISPFPTYSSSDQLFTLKEAYSSQ